MEKKIARDPESKGFLLLYVATQIYSQLLVELLFICLISGKEFTFNSPPEGDKYPEKNHGSFYLRLGASGMYLFFFCKLNYSK